MKDDWETMGFKNSIFAKWMAIAIVGCFISFQGMTQSPEPISYYSFDGGTAEDTGVGDRNGMVQGNPVTICGVSGDALQFDGMSDYISFSDEFSSIFRTNFTLSFYMQPIGGSGEQQLFSYSNGCNSDVNFEITYSPSNRLLRVEYGENDQDRIVMEATLEADRCWYHIMVIRDGRNQSLWVDNERVATAVNQIRIDFTNSGDFGIADGPCVGTLFERFHGALDEVRIYNEVLGILDREALYLAPQSILTSDTLIYLGGEVPVRVAPGCSQSFSWSPTRGVSDPTAEAPILRPDTTTTYTLNFSEQNCSTFDQVRVLVVDPEDVGCETLAMPTAFTPNGDGINDQFGISNPFVIDDLIAFRVFDKNGGLIFETEDPFGTWDGSYRGKKLNSGTYLYQIQYLCEGDEKQQQGTILIMR